MGKNRGLKTRTVVSNAIDTTLWEKLKDYSNETSIPLSKLLDKSIGNFLEELKDTENTQKNEKDLLKFLKQNKNLDIKFFMFDNDEMDLIPLKLEDFDIGYGHFHEGLEFDDEDEYFDFLEYESGYDKKTIKQLKNKFNMTPYVSIRLEE